MLLLALTACRQAPLADSLPRPATAATAGADSLFERALVITDPAVVRDSPLAAALAFESQIAAIAAANNSTADTLLKRWIAEWEPSAHDPADSTLPAPDDRVAKALHEVRAGRLTFRLLAITNRLDLARVRSSPMTAGETRLVFELQNRDGTSAQPFTLIFEFGQVARATVATEAIVQTLAMRWLSLPEPGDPAYLDALAAIVLDQVQPGHLLRIRTNEELGGGGWELREFSHDLQMQRLAGTPHEQFKRRDKFPGLDTYLHSRSGDLVRGAAIFNDSTGQTLLGYWAQDPFPWSGLREPEDRSYYLFRLNTCTGCHAEEAPDAGNRHIKSLPRDTDGKLQTVLSDFLQGNFKPDFSLPGCTALTPWCSPAPDGYWNEVLYRSELLRCFSRANFACGRDHFPLSEALVPFDHYRYH